MIDDWFLILWTVRLYAVSQFRFTDYSKEILKLTNKIQWQRFQPVLFEYAHGHPSRIRQRYRLQRQQPQSKPIQPIIDINSYNVVLGKNYWELLPFNLHILRNEWRFVSYSIITICFQYQFSFKISKKNKEWTSNSFQK